MNLNVKLESEAMGSQWNNLKWFFAVLLVSVIVTANIFLPTQTNTLRFLWNLVACLLVLGVVALTHQGKRALSFAKDARIELRKVIWPTRQETVQSTLMIMVVVIITALFLWGVDSFLLWAVSFVTNQ